MSQPKIYFLTFHGPTITPEFSDVLFIAAQKMFKEKQDQELIKDENWETVVSTKWKLVGIGTIFGYEFSATIEYGNKTTEVKFLSRKTDLSLTNLETVYRHSDLKPTYPSQN